MSVSPPHQVLMLKHQPLIWWYLEMGLREVVKVRWGHDGISALSLKRRQGALVMWAHIVRRWLPTSQEKWPQNETYPVSTLIMDFPASRTARNNFPLCKPSRLWYFAIEAQADKNACLVGAFVNCYQEYLPCWKILVLSFLHLHHHQLTWGLRLPTARQTSSWVPCFYSSLFQSNLQTTEWNIQRSNQSSPQFYGVVNRSSLN